MSISEEQFDQTLYNLRHMGMDVTAAVIRARDTAQREALARVEAERDKMSAVLDRVENERKSLQEQGGQIAVRWALAVNERKATQAKLAEAVGLLRYSQEIARLFDDEHTAEVGRFLARYAQAEQQEAQGAQAGDEAKSFDRWWTSTEILRKNKMMLAQEAWMARAALATQAAAGESAKYWAFHNEFGELRIEDRWDVAKHLPYDLIPLITPPAAAHGDEAVRKDAERYRWVRNGSNGLAVTMVANHSDAELDAAIDAAMRAQGDGGGE